MRTLSGPNGWGKRGFDILWASFWLMVLAPVLACIALMVFLDDGWPVLFIQDRVGKDGKPFPFLKFRTMVRNAERIGAGYEIEAADARITRTGHFLRKSSLDELPQFANILWGHMSFVGPRPTLQYQVDTYTPCQRRRLEVRPGLTGLAQVSGRNSISWPRRIELDVEYIDTYSFWLDIRIIARTFLMLLKPAGIYGEGWAKKKGDPGYPGSAT